METTRLRLNGRVLVVVFVWVLTICTLAYALLLNFDLSSAGERVSVTDIQKEVGLAYIGKLSNSELSDHEQPTAARLQLVEERPGNFLTRIRSSLGDSFAFAWVVSLYTANYPNSTYEVSIPLGPAHSVHDDIRKLGDGRFSIWRGHVYFSLPKDKALERVKRLEVVVPSSPVLNVENLRAAVGTGAIIAALCLVVLGVATVVRPLVRGNKVVQSVVPGVVICLILTVLMVVGGEVYMRVADMFPTNRRVWASEFIPTLGWRFKPGAEVVWTNGINYWSRSRVNSIGFLDKEPILPKPSGTFRVMIVGDSMVQAVEVALDKRLQVRLAELLQKSMAPRAVDVVALGYSGTGQSNQLPFFEHFKDQLNPDLLILVIASNDLANNSPLLEAIRYGWHPEHLPRVFFRKRSDGSCSRIPIDPSWERHILPAGSEFDRLQKLREMSSDYKAKLEGWNPAPSEVASLDFVFFNPGPLPPAFEEAVALTRCSFQEWKRLAEREGLPLIAVAAPGLTGTESDKTGYLQRVLSILDESKIPLLNLYPEFVKRGNVPDAHLKFDGHWTVTGHRWAAEAISDYLGREGYLERRSR